MRVLHVVEATTAGVRRHVFSLASAMYQRRYETSVACPPMRDHAFGDHAFTDDLRRAGVQVFPISMARAIRPVQDAVAFRELFQLIRSERIDLVHAHSSKAGILGRVAARLAGVASVYTPHGLFFLGLHTPLKRRMFQLIEQTAGRIGNRVIAVSPGEHALLLKTRIAPPEQVVCIENGIALPHLPQTYHRTSMRAACGATANGPLIGTIARVAAQKNPRRFLEAAAQLLRNQSQARFVWCGSGEQQTAAEQWARDLGIAHAVRFLGHREDALEVLAALDVFWLSSDYEGLPTVLLEALALRVPIVATDVVGTRDVLRGEAGMLVSENPQAMARATERLLERVDWQQGFTRAGAALAERRWNEARMVRETEALYDAVIAEHRSTARNQQNAAANEHATLEKTTIV